MTDIINMYFDYIIKRDIIQVEGGKSMIISLCGDNTHKKTIVKELKEIYKDSIVICDYFKISFDTTIELEKQLHESIDSKKEELKKADIDIIKFTNKTRKRHKQLISINVDEKVSNFLETNKDKIILLVSDSILCKDINRTKFFTKSDLKILIDVDKTYSTLKLKQKYNKNKFDYVIDNMEKIDVKKLVKL